MITRSFTLPRSILKIKLQLYFVERGHMTERFDMLSQVLTTELLTYTSGFQTKRFFLN